MLIPRKGRAEPNADPSAEPRTGVENEREGERTTDFARRVLAHAASPEEKLEQLLAEHRRELEEQAARFEEAMQDLERREQLLKDMRLSVERLLRLGTTDLSEREVELQELGREFMQREARLSEVEAELSRRRSELGAVELKREAVEQRERALAAREAELDARAAPAGEGAATDQGTPAGPSVAEAPASLLFVPGATYRLVEAEPRELDRGTELEVDGETYVVTRIGASPLPGDGRRCAYLERGARGSAPSGGSS